MSSQKRRARIQNIQEANRKVLSEQVIHDVDEALRMARENGSVEVSADVVHNKLRDYREPTGVYIISDGDFGPGTEGVYRAKQHHYGDYGEYGDQTITHIPDDVFRREMEDKISTFQDMVNKLR